MVRGALDREVEGDLDAVLAACRDERVELLQRAELGMDRVVAADLVMPDRPRRAGVACLRGHRVVAALAIRHADRMDGREVEDVEAELGEARDLRLDTGEAAEGPREQLVPGPEPRADAIDVERDGRRERGGALAHGVPRDGREELGVERRLVLDPLGRRWILEALERRGD